MYYWYIVSIISFCELSQSFFICYILLPVQDQVLIYTLHLVMSVIILSFIFLIFIFSFIFISWKLITLQYCRGFYHTLTWISHGFTCVPHPSPPSNLPPHPIPLGLPSARALSTCLMHPTWAWDSHLIVYLFQCYSLRTSDTCLLPQSPKVCSIHLCLFFCFAYRVIVSIF